MVISGSFLKIEKDNKAIKELALRVPQIHFDVMDGEFTENKTVNPSDISFGYLTPKIDVHLMVLDVPKYVDMISVFNPIYITFHVEIGNTLENINYIKSCGYKVGIAINPGTDFKLIYPFLDVIDLVLVMSVKAGASGQAFIDISDRIEELCKYREDNGLSFVIEVDGGINDKTIKKIRKADICVVGSFITDSKDYEGQIEILRRSIDE